MPEDIFRIVVTGAVLLAGIAFVVQAGVVMALYKTVRRMQARVEPLIAGAEPVVGKLGPMIDKVGPVIDKVGPVIDKTGDTVDKIGPILQTGHRILEEVRPRIAEVSEEAVAISKSARKQVEKIGDIVVDAGGRARERLVQIDETVGATVEQVGEVGGAVKRAMLVPVREANGIAAGISAAMSTIVHRPRRPSVDLATTDEEMFI